MELFSGPPSLYTTSILAVCTGFILGVLLEKTLLKRLIHITGRTKWKSDDLVLHNMKGLIWPLLGLAGLYTGLKTLPDLPERTSQWCDKGITLAVILIITIYINRILSEIVITQTFREDRQGKPSILVNLVRTIIFAVGIMVGLQSLGVSIQPLLTALGITGLAVALALQSTLSNFFSGLHIIASKRIRPGDYVRLENDLEGYVNDINWRSTTLQQLSNNLVIIPNNKLADAIVINTYMPGLQSSVSIETGVSYDSDLEHVERIAIETAREIIRTIDSCQKDFEPLLRFHTFGDSSIDFTVFLRVNDFPDQYYVKSEYIKLLHRRFKEEGIEIPFPIRTLINKPPDTRDE
ncbi:MAG TPA: mechanosensitive ion channel family protein [Bacteroidales bacterium]|nr:mechanosensitive ion channel family protein [Bacteroidales bacterium]HSA42458.1 mechanosensitive ion channel family protein [Bacteroidales bacterium]